MDITGSTFCISASHAYAHTQEFPCPAPYTHSLSHVDQLNLARTRCVTHQFIPFQADDGKFSHSALMLKEQLGSMVGRMTCFSISTCFTSFTCEQPIQWSQKESNLYSSLSKIMLLLHVSHPCLLCCTILTQQSPPSSLNYIRGCVTQHQYDNTCILLAPEIGKATVFICLSRSLIPAQLFPTSYLKTCNELI